MQYADEDVEARRRLQSLAAQGNADAQFELAVLLYRGRGGPEDLAEARRLFDLAAAQGLAAAQYKLG